jgi:hypothetical protein
MLVMATTNCVSVCLSLCVCFRFVCERGFNRRERERRINLCSRTKTREKVFDQHHEKKKEEKQLQTRGEKDKGVSLSLCVSVFHDLIIFTLAAFVFLGRSGMVSQVSVLFVCRFRAPFFSQVM